MTAKSFIVCDIEKFHNQSYKFEYQADLFEDDEEFLSEGSQNISITFDSNSVNELGFKRLLGNYDHIHNKSGKVFNKYFSRYFEEFNFPIYLNEKLSLALIQIKTDIGLEFIKTLNKEDYYQLNIIDIDFEKIVQNVPEISGAWFAELKGKHLKSKGLFGPQVNLSDEYQHAIKDGKISSMLIQWIHEGIEFKINISKKGSVTLLNKIKSPDHEIAILLSIYNQLLKK